MNKSNKTWKMRNHLEDDQGRLLCMVRAYNRARRWNVYTVEAGVSGRLECVKYAHDNKRPCKCSKIKKHDQSLDLRPSAK